MSRSRSKERGRSKDGETKKMKLCLFSKNQLFGAGFPPATSTTLEKHNLMSKVDGELSVQ